MDIDGHSPVIVAEGSSNLAGEIGSTSAFPLSPVPETDLQTAEPMSHHESSLNFTAETVLSKVSAVASIPASLSTTHNEADSSSDGTEATIVPQHFHPFPRLPIELRLKIWGLGIERRIIRLTSTPSKRIWIARASKTPTLFSVSKEAREEMFRLYDRPFRGSYIRQSSGSKGLSSVRRHLHVNLTRDIVYLQFTRSSEANRRCLSKILKNLFQEHILQEGKITQLAFEGWAIDEWRPRLTNLMEDWICPEMTSVKNVILTYSHEDRWVWRNLFRPHYTNPGCGFFERIQEKCPDWKPPRNYHFGNGILGI